MTLGTDATILRPEDCAPIPEATALWYRLISSDRHKDQDCHFSMTVTFSYNGSRTITVTHHGYLAGAWSAPAKTFTSALTLLLRRICQQILDECAYTDETDFDLKQHRLMIRQELLTRLQAWQLQDLIPKPLLPT
ncbi:MAG: hypothetical protein AAB433_02580 [Nitrospirota bacterium]|jgi:hypothetical protein